MALSAMTNCIHHVVINFKFLVISKIYLNTIVAFQKLSNRHFELKCYSFILVVWWDSSRKQLEFYILKYIHILCFNLTVLENISFKFCWNCIGSVKQLIWRIIVKATVTFFLKKKWCADWQFLYFYQLFRLLQCFYNFPFSFFSEIYWRMTKVNEYTISTWLSMYYFLINFLIIR